jgi:hypothetical protein
MEIHSDYYTTDILDKGKESAKIDKKFNDYKLKFNSNYLEIKNSLNEIQDNIINYNSELKKLEKFLNEINEHDKNYREIIKRLNKLAEYLQETINIEKIINQLSNNQQVINMQEYISIYNRVKAIYKFFEESKLHEKEDYLNKLNNMMSKGFKEFEELFYVLLKKYEQMKLAKNTEKNNNEKSKLLEKIRKLSVCLQDEKIGFNFTSKFVVERRQKIKDKLEEVTLFSKTLNKQKYEKGSSELIKLFIESISIYENEEKYIKFIFSECDKTLHEKILKEIMKQPLGQIITLFTKLISNHKRFDNSLAHSMPVEYFKNLDVIDLWVQQISPFYNNKIKNSNPEEYKNINEFISQIKKFCSIYIKNFLDKVEKLNDENIENENLLNITTDTIDFLSSLIMYNNAYSLIQQELKQNKENNNIDLSPRNFILILVEQLEEKSKILLKRYRPLKNILLINNYFYIHSKISKQPLSEFFDKNDLSKIKEKINLNSKEYLKNTWKKIAEITFNDKNDIVYEKESNELKAISKELIKKRFITFNEEMKINLKVQQHIQIIDKNIEMLMIKNNISYVTKRYQIVLDRYKNVNFSKNVDKIILYKNIEQIEQELRTYFSIHMDYQI